MKKMLSFFVLEHWLQHEDNNALSVSCGETPVCDNILFHQKVFFLFHALIRLDITADISLLTQIQSFTEKYPDGTWDIWNTERDSGYH